MGTAILISLGSTPRRATAGRLVGRSFTLHSGRGHVRGHVQRVGTAPRSPQQCTTGSRFPRACQRSVHPWVFTIAVLTGAQGYATVVLICISRLPNGVGPFFMSLFATQMLLEEMSGQVFCPFSL